jgi:hypothetical protein
VGVSLGDGRNNVEVARREHGGYVDDPQRTGHDGLSNTEPNWMWMCGKFVMIGARRMFFNGLVDNRTETSMMRIVMFAFLAG